MRNHKKDELTIAQEDGGLGTLEMSEEERRALLEKWDGVKGVQEVKAACQKVIAAVAKATGATLR